MSSRELPKTFPPKGSRVCKSEIERGRKLRLSVSVEAEFYWNCARSSCMAVRDSILCRERAGNWVFQKAVGNHTCDNTLENGVFRRSLSVIISYINVLIHLGRPYICKMYGLHKVVLYKDSIFDFNVTDVLCVHRVSKIWVLVLRVNVTRKVAGVVYSPSWRNVYNNFPFNFSILIIKAWENTAFCDM